MRMRISRSFALTFLMIERRPIARRQGRCRRRAKTRQTDCAPLLSSLTSATRRIECVYCGGEGSASRDVRRACGPRRSYHGGPSGGAACGHLTCSWRSNVAAAAGRVGGEGAVRGHYERVKLALTTRVRRR